MTVLVATGVRTLLADVTAFRTWTGSADQAEALARIFIAGVDAGSYTRPFAMIFTSASPAARRFAGGARDYLDQTGRVLVLLEDDVDADDLDSLEDAYLQFASDAGGIVDGMEVLAGQAGYPHLRSIEVVEPPRRSDEDEGDEYMQTLLGVEWGL